MIKARPRRDVLAARGSWPIAWTLWLLFFAVVAAMVVADPVSRTVTPSYRAAAEGFLAGRDIYHKGQHGWIYPLWSALAYVPFTLPPMAVGEVLWRLFTIGLMALATWRLAGWVDRSIRLWPARWRPDAEVGPTPADAGRTHFLVLTLLVIPAAIGSARNGQSNLPLAALFVLATIDAADRKWWRSAILLGAAVLLKPIAMVPLLLLVALHPPMWWRSPIVLAVVASLPFARPDWAYVAQQYREGLAKVLEAGEPGAGTFAELTNLLRLVGVELEHGTMTAVRAAMALATLGAGWVVLRQGHSAWAPIAVLGLGTSYLMLFNPRTEGNSYPILAPALAAAAVWAMAWGYGRSPGSVVRPIDRWSARAGWALVVGCVVLGIAHLFVPGGKDRVLRPLVALMFYGWLMAEGANRLRQSAVHSKEQETTP